MTNSLCLQEVNYIYAPDTTAQHTALSDIDLEVHPGSFLLVLGHTGSGKSTLLRIAAGLLAPTSGVAHCNNEQINPGDIGIVFQQPETQLFERRIYDEILFGPRNLGLVETEEQETRLVEASLAQVGMNYEDFADRSPFSLSGGEARRVAIASVLATNPSVILFDEPTAGLDTQGREFLHELIENLRKNTVSVVVVSHDLDEFLPRAESVILLEEGKKTWQGSAESLIADPRPIEKAQMKLPAILEFQKQLGREWGTLSYDPQIVANWALGCEMVQQEKPLKEEDR